MLKKVYITFVLIFTMLFFSGCAEGGYAFMVLDGANGEIYESFYVEIDPDIVESAGYNYADVENEVVTAFNNVITNLRNSFTAVFHGDTPMQDYTIESRVLARVDNAASVNNGTIQVEFRFNDIEDYYLFYNFDPLTAEPPEDYLEENFFYTKKTSVRKTYFDGTQQSSLATSFLTYFNDNGTQIFDFTDIQFTHSYASTNTKLRSNADNVYYFNSGDNKVKVHEWIIPKNNYEIEREFYEYSINRVAWYILALVLTGIFLIVVVIKHFYNEKKKPIEEINEIETIKE